jgi:hypothetical protein
MTSNPHGLDVLGYTRATMAATMGREGVSRSEPPKRGLSSDCRLQPACMKPELLVIADQHAAVNPFPGLVHTARHTTRVGHTRSRVREPSGGAAVDGGVGDWGEVVTR